MGARLSLMENGDRTGAETDLVRPARTDYYSATASRSSANVAPSVLEFPMRKTSAWIGSLFLVAGLAAIAAVQDAAAQVARTTEDRKPNLVDRHVAKEVAKLMQARHISNHPLDDDVGRKGFEQYIKALDGTKLYFMQSDIDEFSAQATQVDDMLVKGDLSLAFGIFERFLQRVDQRVAMAEKIIDEPMDFAVEEEMETDPKILAYPATEEEAVERWRKRLKYQLLIFKGDKGDEEAGKDAALDPKERLKKRFRSFANRMHQFDSDDVLELFVTAVTSSYDPHTTYFSKSTFENFLIEMGLRLEGIGATLQAGDDGLTIIKRIVPGGAADKNGNIKVDDKIVSVAQGNDGEWVDVTDMKLDDVVHMIRGTAGTVVRLSVLPSDSNELKTVVITREKIELKDSEARGIVFDSGTKSDGTPYKIGWIDLPSFYSEMEDGNNSANAKSTTRDMRRILDDFKSKQVDAVVLDLSSNGGGSLREAIDATGLFIDRGPVVQVKDSFGQIYTHNDTASGMAWDGPLVVLTSKFSASASEILAGAVQDYRRGIVVGDSATHGKGTVQHLIDLDQQILNTERPVERMFGALKITMQQFYRPLGDSTQKRGVEADVVLPSITDKMDVSESDLDYALEFDRVPAAKFAPLSLVNGEMLEMLRKRSEERLTNSQDFQKLVRRINLYVEQKAKDTVSLNEERFFARRNELNAEKEDEKALEKQVNPGEITRDYFVDEVLNIAVDYLQLLRDGKIVQR